MGGVTFQSPGWLWLLVAVPLLAAAGVMWVRGARRARERWADPALIALAPARGHRTARAVAAALALAGVATAVVALARPSVTDTEGEARSTVVLTVDVSASMNRTDLAPNRLVAAVDAAGRFLDQAPAGTSIGLVAFARSARVLVAPTLDHGRVRAALATLATIRGRTALGEALVTALASLRAAGAVPATPGDPLRSPGRILVLTDGVDTARLATTPADAAERAAADGIPIFTILLGDDPGEGGPTPAETLAAIATRTGGVFTQTATTPDLRAVFSDLGSVITPVERLRELTVWWAGAALALLLCAALVGALAAGGKPARSRVAGGTLRP